MSSAKKIVIYGAGGHGRVIAEAAVAQGWSHIHFADGDPNKQGRKIGQHSVVATGMDASIKYCFEHEAALVLGVGDNRIRATLFADFVAAGLTMARVIHPRAYLAPNVVIGKGCVVFAGVVINVDSSIGENVIVNTSASLDHDNIIADHVHISPGAHTGGTVSIGEGTHIGLGSSVRNNIDIGAWSVVGAGSVVVKDIADEVVAFGNPARLRKA